MSDSVNQEKLKQLRAPFPPSAISKLPKGGAMLDFVGHANVTDRLLNIDPLWNWEPFALDERGLPSLDYDAQGKPVGLWIRLTVCGVTRIGYGTCEARKNEPIKELIGDSLRNAAMRFGVALDLWAKGELESQHGEDAAPVNGNQPAPRPQRASQAPQRANNGSQSAAPRNDGSTQMTVPFGDDKGVPFADLDLRKLQYWHRATVDALDPNSPKYKAEYQAQNQKRLDHIADLMNASTPAAPTPAQMAARDAIPMTGALPREQLAAEFDGDDSDPFADDPPYPAN